MQRYQRWLEKQVTSRLGVGNQMVINSLPGQHKAREKAKRVRELNRGCKWASRQHDHDTRSTLSSITE